LLCVFLGIRAPVYGSEEGSFSRGRALILGFF
jgi:hypothetical protein